MRWDGSPNQPIPKSDSIPDLRFEVSVVARILALLLVGIVALAACFLGDTSLFLATWGSHHQPPRTQSPPPVPKRPLPPGFLDAECTLASGEKARYVLYTPQDHNPSRPYPLIVSLHGVGKRGTDGRTQLKDGLANTVSSWPEWRKFDRFLVLFPQGRSGKWLTGSADDDLVMEELADLRSRYSVDPARIYLTGISSGGTGTWELAAAHPDLWAGIVPVCGVPNPEDTVAVRHLPCWWFHGTADPVAPLGASREMTRRLSAEGAEIRSTEYPKAQHNIWDKAYRTPELYEWLLRHKRD
jgi:predicted peptidase